MNRVQNSSQQRYYGKAQTDCRCRPFAAPIAVFLAVAALLFSCVGAPKASPAVNTAAAPEPSAVPRQDPSLQVAGPRFFYTVFDVQGRVAGWLQGSIHVGTAELYPLHPALAEAIKAADAVYAELSPAEIAAAPAAASKAFAASSAKDRKALRNGLPAAEYAYLESLLGSSMLAAYERYQPWVLYLAISTATVQNSGLDAALGVDDAVMKLAASLGKDVLGFETAAYQLGVFAATPEADQMLLLRDTIAELRDDPDALKKLYDCYLRDDRPGLAALSEASTRRSLDFAPSLAGFYERLLRDRNASWVRALDADMRAGRKVFVVAGAAHFVGKESVPESLSALGYTVKEGYYP